MLLPYSDRARQAIALADREAAERVAVPSASAVELVDRLIGLARSNPPGSDDQPKGPEDAARGCLLRHIAVAEAGGAVPAGVRQFAADMASSIRGLQRHYPGADTVHLCGPAGNVEGLGPAKMFLTTLDMIAAAPRPPAVGTEKNEGTDHVR